MQTLTATAPPPYRLTFNATAGALDEVRRRDYSLSESHALQGIAYGVRGYARMRIQ
jgi:hypothetical protein